MAGVFKERGFELSEIWRRGRRIALKSKMNQGSREGRPERRFLEFAGNNEGIVEYREGGTKKVEERGETTQSLACSPLSERRY